jgi:MFS family permease
VAAASLATFVVHERRRTEPLVDLRFFRSVPFSSATVTAVAAFSALGGFLFVNTLYLQEVRGLSALQAGLDTLPMAVMTMVASPISGHLVGRRGPRLPLVVSGLCLAAACAMLAQVGPTTSFTWLFAAYFVFGTGFGLVNAPITNAAVSGMPRAQAGVASAIASTSRQVGMTLGVALVGALVASAVPGTVGAGFAGASHVGWWLLAGCGMLVFVLGLVSTTRRAQASAERAAALLNPDVVVVGS